MTEAEEYLEKQEGYNIECILENPDFRLAVIELLQSYAEEHLKKRVKNFDEKKMLEEAKKKCVEFYGKTDSRAYE